MILRSGPTCALMALAIGSFGPSPLVAQSSLEMHVGIADDGTPDRIWREALLAYHAPEDIERETQAAHPFTEDERRLLELVAARIPE